MWCCALVLDAALCPALLRTRGRGRTDGLPRQCWRTGCLRRRRPEHGQAWAIEVRLGAGGAISTSSTCLRFSDTIRCGAGRLSRTRRTNQAACRDTSVPRRGLLYPRNEETFAQHLLAFFLSHGQRGVRSQNCAVILQAKAQPASAEARGIEDCTNNSVTGAARRKSGRSPSDRKARHVWCVEGQARSRNSYPTMRPVDDAGFRLYIGCAESEWLDTTARPNGARHDALIELSSDDADIAMAHRNRRSRAVGDECEFLSIELRRF